MYSLAKIFPAARRIRNPFTRDQWMLLMAATNEILLGLETYLAHLTSGTIVPYEWIPIIFGPVAGVLLLLAGLLALRKRSLATLIATPVFIASIVVGLLGAYFHLMRAILPYAAPGQQVSVPLFVWAPPILGPLTFALVGLLGISSAWIEDPPDSGTLVLIADRRLKLPYSKTRAYSRPYELLKSLVVVADCGGRFRYCGRCRPGLLSTAFARRSSHLFCCYAVDGAGGNDWVGFTCGTEPDDPGRDCRRALYSRGTRPGPFTVFRYWHNRFARFARLQRKACFVSSRLRATMG